MKDITNIKTAVRNTICGIVMLISLGSTASPSLAKDEAAKANELWKYSKNTNNSITVIVDRSRVKLYAIGNNLTASFYPVKGTEIGDGKVTYDAPWMVYYDRNHNGIDNKVTVLGRVDEAEIHYVPPSIEGCDNIKHHELLDLNHMPNPIITNYHEALTLGYAKMLQDQKKTK